MRFITLLSLLVLIASCSEKAECVWSTVEDLDKADLVKCKADSDFFYMRKFSGGFDSIRKQLDIPLLPKSFHAFPSSFGGGVVWANQKIREENKTNSISGKAYIDRKLLRWSGDTLIYDITNVRFGNEKDEWHSISYYRDTIKNDGAYLFEYFYSNKTFSQGEHLVLSKQQSDSILKAWRLSY